MDDGDRMRSYFISGNPFLDIARGTATVRPVTAFLEVLEATDAPAQPYQQPDVLRMAWHVSRI